MKKIILFLYIFSLFVSLSAQNNYWQQQVNFNITVSLNDKDHTLTAFETVEYINQSPDTLHYIWFHIWPNAYKNDRTAFSEQRLREGITDFYFSKPYYKGYINQLDFKADGITAATENDSGNIDVVKVLLPKPLPPRSKTIISTPFKVKLPYNFSRGGHVGNDYQVSQWFPKPAVYDRKGWHPMPYLDQGEFYSEFGSFDVEITTPSAYVVGAAGILQDGETLQQLKDNGKHTIEGSTKTWHYKQDNIHDFAWFASKSFIVKYDTVILPSKKIIDVFSYYKPKAKGWSKSIEYAKQGLKKYSNWIGDYPYTVVSMVQGSDNDNSGGMEYPTITLITTQDTGRELETTIVHEIGHNWFYGALATNERTHPWMDEGMNTFYEKRYEAEKYSVTSNSAGGAFGNKLPRDEEKWLLATMVSLAKDQPIEMPSEKFTTLNYELSVYYKTSIWMQKMKDELGADNFDQAMHSYYDTWKFKHPYPEDFKSSLEKSTGKDVSSFFAILNQTGPVSAPQKKTIKPSFLFNLREAEKYNYINFAPAVGYNIYDKGMVGGLVHNYQLPLNKLQFIGGVLYGTGSKKLNGFGNVSYNIYKRTRDFSAGLSYISYSQNDFTNVDNSKLIMGVKRWVPSAKVTFFDKDPLSTRRTTIQWKTFLLNEGTLGDFNTTISGTDTFEIASIKNVRSYINRLSFDISDNRVLYPYSLNLSADQGKDFIRAGITAKYYFNYPDGKSGLDARFFAGKFFYLHPDTRNTTYLDRYFFNISGPKGNADYTYSDYFIGRNEFEGKNGKGQWTSQQIMERDGFFKVNAEQLGYFGKTDDWLAALNISTDLPDNVNPLSVLPFRLPLKLFADAGTYAEAWKTNPASGRFIYDAGIQLSLFRSFIDIYIPLFYSKIYRDYYKTNIPEKRFLKTISFTINIRKLKVNDFLKDVPL